MKRRFVAFPIVDGLGHPCFGCDTESVGDSVDVIEIANDLDGDAELFVCPAELFQFRQVLFTDFAGLQSQSDGVIT